MSLPPVSRLVPVLFAGACLAALAVALAAQEAAAQTSVCEQDLPTATDGRLTLDRSTVRPGDDILGLLTDFQQWPAGVIGGGSGETFLSCTPWAPGINAEVIRSQSAPFVLLPVPASAAAGTYTVGVVFQEGSTVPGPPSDGRTARLTATVTVATQAAPPGTGASPACQLPAGRASVGQLAADGTARPGGTLGVTLMGVPPGRIATMNEYDRLWYVACFAGAATPVAHVEDAPTTFGVSVPNSTMAGPQVLRVTALVDGQVVAWEQSITVAGPTTPAPGVLAPTGGTSLARLSVGLTALVLGGLALLASRPGWTASSRRRS